MNPLVAWWRKAEARYFFWAWTRHWVVMHKMNRIEARISAVEARFAALEARLAILEVVASQKDIAPSADRFLSG